MWGGLYTAVGTCAHRVHSAEQVFGDTDGETDGLAVDVGDQDFRGHRRARAKDLKMENVWGVEEHAANKGSLLLQHFIFYLDIAIVCCWAICGLSTCVIYKQGLTWTNTAPTRFNVGLLVEVGDGGGGALVPGSGSRT